MKMPSASAYSLEKSGVLSSDNYMIIIVSDCRNPGKHSLASPQYTSNYYSWVDFKET